MGKVGMTAEDRTLVKKVLGACGMHETDQRQAEAVLVSQAQADPSGTASMLITALKKHKTMRQAERILELIRTCGEGAKNARFAAAIAKPDAKAAILKMYEVDLRDPVYGPRLGRRMQALAYEALTTCGVRDAPRPVVEEQQQQPPAAPAPPPAGGIQGCTSDASPQPPPPSRCLESRRGSGGPLADPLLDDAAGPADDGNSGSRALGVPVSISDESHGARELPAPGPTPATIYEAEEVSGNRSLGLPHAMSGGSMTGQEQHPCTAAVHDCAARGGVSSTTTERGVPTAEVNVAATSSADAAMSTSARNPASTDDATMPSPLQPAETAAVVERGDAAAEAMGAVASSTLREQRDVEPTPAPQGGGGGEAVKEGRAVEGERTAVREQHEIAMITGEEKKEGSAEWGAEHGGGADDADVPGDENESGPPRHTAAPAPLDAHVVLSEPPSERAPSSPPGAPVVRGNRDDHGSNGSTPAHAMLHPNPAASHALSTPPPTSMSLYAPPSSLKADAAARTAVPAEVSDCGRALAEDERHPTPTHVNPEPAASSPPAPEAADAGSDLHTSSRTASGIVREHAASQATREEGHGSSAAPPPEIGGEDGAHDALPASAGASTPRAAAASAALRRGSEVEGGANATPATESADPNIHGRPAQTDGDAEPSTPGAAEPSVPRSDAHEGGLEVDDVRTPRPNGPSHDIDAGSSHSSTPHAASYVARTVSELSNDARRELSRALLAPAASSGWGDVPRDALAQEGDDGDGSSCSSTPHAASFVARMSSLLAFEAAATTCTAQQPQVEPLWRPHPAPDPSVVGPRDAAASPAVGDPPPPQPHARVDATLEVSSSPAPRTGVPPAGRDDGDSTACVDDADRQGTKDHGDEGDVGSRPLASPQAVAKGDSGEGGEGVMCDEDSLAAGLSAVPAHGHGTAGAHATAPVNGADRSRQDPRTDPAVTPGTRASPQTAVSADRHPHDSMREEDSQGVALRAPASPGAPSNGQRDGGDEAGQDVDAPVTLERDVREIAGPGVAKGAPVGGADQEQWLPSEQYEGGTGGRGQHDGPPGDDEGKMDINLNALTPPKGDVRAAASPEVTKGAASPYVDGSRPPLSIIREDDGEASVEEEGEEHDSPRGYTDGEVDIDPLHIDLTSPETAGGRMRDDGDDDARDAAGADVKEAGLDEGVPSTAREDDPLADVDLSLLASPEPQEAEAETPGGGGGSDDDQSAAAAREGHASRRVRVEEPHEASAAERGDDDEPGEVRTNDPNSEGGAMPADDADVDLSLLGSPEPTPGGVDGGDEARDRPAGGTDVPTAMTNGPDPDPDIDLSLLATPGASAANAAARESEGSGSVGHVRRGGGGGVCDPTAVAAVDGGGDDDEVDLSLLSDPPRPTTAGATVTATTADVHSAHGAAAEDTSACGPTGAAADGGGGRTRRGPGVEDEAVASVTPPAPPASPVSPAGGGPNTVHAGHITRASDAVDRSEGAGVGTALAVPTYVGDIFAVASGSGGGGAPRAAPRAIPGALENDRPPARSFFSAIPPRRSVLSHASKQRAVPRCAPSTSPTPKPRYATFRNPSLGYAFAQEYACSPERPPPQQQQVSVAFTSPTMTSRGASSSARVAPRGMGVVRSLRSSNAPTSAGDGGCGGGVASTRAAAVPPPLLAGTPPPAVAATAVSFAAAPAVRLASDGSTIHAARISPRRTRAVAGAHGMLL